MDLKITKSVTDQYKILNVNTVSDKTIFTSFENEQIEKSIKETKLYILQDKKFSRKFVLSDKILKLSRPYENLTPIGTSSSSEDYDYPYSDVEIDY